MVLFFSELQKWQALKRLQNNESHEGFAHLVDAHCVALRHAAINAIRDKQAKRKLGKTNILSSEEDDSITDIGILKGKYAGVVYQYGKAKIVEEGSFARLTFDYTIINASSFDMNDLQNDEEFVTMIGDILTEILLEKPDEKTRNYHTEELNFQ